MQSVCRQGCSLGACSSRSAVVVSLLRSLSAQYLYITTSPGMLARDTLVLLLLFCKLLIVVT
jgi:hypothetical protein